MKLTPEEVYPYLPYDVQCAFTNGKGEVTTYIVNESNVSDLFKYGNVKLALRPLSDLTPDDALNYGYIDLKDLMFEVDKKVAPYWVMIDLHKRKMDVFGLIPQGKAIEKNTLDS